MQDVRTRAYDMEDGRRQPRSRNALLGEVKEGLQGTDDLFTRS